MNWIRFSTRASHLFLTKDVKSQWESLSQFGPLFLQIQKLCMENDKVSHCIPLSGDYLAIQDVSAPSLFSTTPTKSAFEHYPVWVSSWTLVIREAPGFMPFKSRLHPLLSRTSHFGPVNRSDSGCGNLVDGLSQLSTPGSLGMALHLEVFQALCHQWNKGM